MTSALGERSTDASKSEVTTEIPQSASARQSRPYKYCITLLVILIPALYYLYRDRLPWHKGQYPYRPDNDDRYWTLDHPPKDQEPEPFYPIKRYSLEYRGVYGLDTSRPWRCPISESTVSAIRNDHSTRSRRMHFAQDYGFTGLASGRCLLNGLRASSGLRFPESGGVWFVDTSDGWEGLHPQRMGLYNAITMEERCNVLKDLGGKFCQDIQTCPEMAPLLAPPEAWIGV
ncbi:conserved hypothetical protein [Microsporum canis CBS 113480]|uniref:Uncharacterized protein n=1 Tax=Arthroderma otae (strain ATCC MYA-4605 / CBS 113480) TaxID=554155 RepID=C5FYT8_ARTOC|nr:conserved hypothetical protein [Microsporum canis CBS 113480]EEQ34686.1 conserved hypothetical protein [Microsporum canis CBS 113480]